MSTQHIHEAQWTPGVPGVREASVPTASPGAGSGGGRDGAQPAATRKPKRATNKPNTEAPVAPPEEGEG